ncbi:TGF beta receptor associated protein 1 [Blastomyces dermatitidis ER-3]|uniref:TGF beta receptor associated protein 1 n=2 Tax=Blastomyces TaxID=229219 RepID=A0A179US70_BLAGS|nr:TGF beta receptor associated protein 1 [Blastomyces gilchristii SLH14081]XP_045276635.1 TGF beta receptor associated protein 1 [Blastomyces dermatitidis ER-3]EEQ89785.2 TGF beta receptor associated protein 1 [Blastomyces dermatitidis ER-3]OAT10623.1 TGF beta receptor associated protein 1 [Blastomyces gilchristii SLH14081]
MSSDDDIDSPRKRRRIAPPETGPYVLRQLIESVPVAGEGSEQEVYITCVEYWNDNLYIGTSLGEVLHFVSFPSDSEESAEPSFILASRLPITLSQSNLPADTPPGVQQILILPSTYKACILCNGVVTFYSLPELSPTYGTTKVGNCKWIGGLDLNEPNEDGQPFDPVVMIAVTNRIMLVRIGDEPRRVRNIEFPGCLVSARRDTIACVADAYSYSLLEVEHRQKIPLFPISSSEESFESGHVEDIPVRTDTPVQGNQPASAGNVPGHSRSASLNTLGGVGRRQPSPSPHSMFPERSSSITPEPSMKSKTLHGPPGSPEKKSPDTSEPSSENGGPGSDGSSSSSQKPLPPPPKQSTTRLKPHVVSPTPSEFLLVTGTEPSEPGVGMFVNVDGDVVRGTLEFPKYPDAIVVDDDSNEGNQPRASDDDQNGYVLAVIGADDNEDSRTYIEAQRWNAVPGERRLQKALVEIPAARSPPGTVGIRRTVGASRVSFSEIVDVMRMVRLKSTSIMAPSIPSTPPENNDPRTRASLEHLQKEKELFDNQETDSDGSKLLSSSHVSRDWEEERNREETKFARGLATVKSSIIIWEGDRIWTVLRNPLALQLDNSLELAKQMKEADGKDAGVDKEPIINIIQGLRDMEPKTETEYIGLRYVRQKASLLLFIDLIAPSSTGPTAATIRATEDALVVGELDPRVVLLLIPLLKGEALQGPQGIWVYNGLEKVISSFFAPPDEGVENKPPNLTMDDNILHLLKRYLLGWQKKRGYGSVTDETYVFNSVDAALLHLLLHLDAKNMREGNVAPGASVRPDLNKLVDNWKGNFDRAVQLLESYNRLFVLSRLYQSRKMAKHVLATWRRIVEGEKDEGKELSGPAADIQIRKYLVKIRDVHLVEEYGPWLAARNPKLGIQVFVDDTSRVKFNPQQVIALLQKRAPGAVQEYLEHLVFTKHDTQYADDLIAYYLDTVLSVLESSAEARASLTESYSTYRALQAPKPSYLSFITHNHPPEPWWQSRLRLLQLLGGGSTTQFTSTTPPTNLSYSISTVLARIEPFKNELVSESIILDGRRGRHREALRLLTHGLSDYDTAIRYCAYGGPTWSTSTVAEIASDTQAELFTYLLTEFLQIADPVCRIERTSNLLARFASVYDITDVLRLVPDEWSVDILSEYLVRVLRGVVSGAREAKVQRALSAGLYLKVDAGFGNKVERLGGWVQDETGIRGLKGSGGGKENDGDDGDYEEERDEDGGETSGGLIGGIIVDGEGILR